MGEEGKRKESDLRVLSPDYMSASIGHELLYEGLQSQAVAPLRVMYLKDQFGCIGRYGPRGMWQIAAWLPCPT